MTNFMSHLHFVIKINFLQSNSTGKVSKEAKTTSKGQNLCADVEIVETITKLRKNEKEARKSCV